MLRRMTAVAFVWAVGMSAAAGGEPEGPKAVFGIDDWLLTVSITGPGEVPVFAKVRMTLPDGTTWADGETDEQGKCSIPKPDTPWCAIEFDIAGARNAPVTLTFLDNGTAVVPLVAPLEPGECCKTVRRFSADDDDPPPSHWRLSPWVCVPVGVAVLALALVSRRMSRIPANERGAA